LHVRVLLDECLPRRLKAYLTGHEVSTVPEMGWAGAQDHTLLRLASPLFDALVSIDKGLPSTMRTTASALALVLLRAPSNRLSDLEPLVPELLRRLTSARPGETIEITAGE
jgi:hypothetical protein